MTDRYAVIGNPIAHTKSPVLHAAFARQCQQDMSYEAIFGPIGEFRETVEAFRRAGGRGMNVTVPFKVQDLALADKLTTRARLAQAVNTLRFDDDGIFGDNTDGIGLVHDIQGRLGFGVEGKRILILGAGGAARGSVLPLAEQRPGDGAGACPQLDDVAGTGGHDFIDDRVAQEPAGGGDGADPPWVGEHRTPEREDGERHGVSLGAAGDGGCIAMLMASVSLARGSGPLLRRTAGGRGGRG